QVGFMPNKSMTDQILTICQVAGKAHEFQHTTYIACVDFKAAFDLVDCYSLKLILEQTGFPYKKNLTNFMATSTPIASSKGKGLPQMKFKSTPIRTEKRKTPTIEKRRSETNIESRKKRWRPGTLALREIRAYQRTYTTLIPRASFGRLVREITSRICPTEL
ncbi:hypothetical protein QYM36_014205, partial [Artemia franciscana]